MPGEAYKVHDEVMAVIKTGNRNHEAIVRLSSAWGDPARHRYLEENLDKISLALSLLAETQASLTDLFNKINMASTTPVVTRRPVLRVVS
jgi:hypothetical protein